MATSLGKVGIVDRGDYLQEETYNAGDFVLYNGSTWLALKDGLIGIEPAESENWKYLARGFEAEVLSMIAANDASGLIGDAGQQVNAQSLIDVIADKVATKLIDKGMIANNLVTENENMVLAAPMGKALQDQITEQNKNLNNYWCLNGGTWIPPNSDLDDYKALGSFFVDTDVGGITIKNSPINTAFTLQVYGSNGHIRDYITQELRSIYLYGGIFMRKFDIFTKSWTDWEKLVQKGDFKRTIEIRLPYIALNGKLYASYSFPIRFNSVPNVELNDYSIDGIGKVDSYGIYLINNEEVIFEFIKTDTNFELGKCYIGRTKFTIS